MVNQNINDGKATSKDNGDFEIEGAYQLKTDKANPAYVEGKVFYDSAKKALSYYNDQGDVVVNTGQEVIFLVENQTGSEISNGTVVYPDPSTVIGLADAQCKSKSRLIAVATHDIPAGETGYVTKLGQVGGLNTSAYVAGTILYLSSTTPGVFTDTKPTDGGYVITVGVVDVQDETNGVITVDTTISELTVEVTDTNGFPLDQRENTTLSYDNLTRTFTITPTTSDFHFYELGDKYEITGPDSVVWSDFEGEHWFYYEQGVLKTLYEPTLPQKETIILNNAFVATVYWNSTDKKVEIDVLDERHGISMSPTSHLYLHLTRGAQWQSGFGLGDIDADANGNANTSVQFSVASGLYFDEDLRHSSDTIPVPATIPVIYNSGTNADIRTDSETGFGILWNTSGGRIYYNEWTGSTWQLSEVPNNDFCLYHIFAMNGQDTNVVSVMGQNTYSTIISARNGANEEISNIISALPFAEMVPIGTIIFQTSDGYANDPKARIRTDGEGNDYVDWRTTELAQGSSPTSHANLTNVELAASGVAFGHINDQAQTIAGLKTFTDGIFIPNNVNFTFGTSPSSTTFVQEGGSLKIQMPSNDNTNFYRIENSDGTAVFSISSNGQMQAEATNGLWFIDPITMDDFLYFDTSQLTKIYDSSGIFNIEQGAVDKDVNVWFTGNNDGATSFNVLNSDIRTVFSVASDGHTAISNTKDSTVGLVDFANYAGQGVTPGLSGLISHHYADAHQFVLDYVGIAGYAILKLTNANNDIRRSDKPAGFYGQGEYLQVSDENGLFFRWFGSNREQTWMQGTWLMASNAANADPAFRWRCYQSNTTYFRWQTLNTFMDGKEFTDTTKNGFLLESGNTATAGLKLNASNGNLRLAASGEIMLETIPTSDPGVTGALWNDSGTVKIAA